MPVKYTKDLLREAIETKGYQIGDFTYGLPNAMEWGNDGKLFIGKYCSIAGGVTILLGGNHRPDWVTTYPFTAVLDTWPEAKGIAGHPSTRGDVRIGNDVWLGQHSTILSGVTIGDGAVVATCSVVTRDVPPYAIVGGNPAQLIKYRFSEAVIASLLEIKWWDWPESYVRSVLPQLVSADIETFLRKAYEVNLAIRADRVADAEKRAQVAREEAARAEITLTQAQAEAAKAAAHVGKQPA
ncbi:MAG TPA: CatB-related O-acetyltransferase [Polyangiaceae bacterium]|jgi:acetyltransferase-like isoleucine patch superfamily enzyme|nr:CatB-related O-acetyltransferase [Polyangiaceae bacterium]